VPAAARRPSLGTPHDYRLIPGQSGSGALPLPGTRLRLLPGGENQVPLGTGARSRPRQGLLLGGNPGIAAEHMDVPAPPPPRYVRWYRVAKLGGARTYCDVNYEGVRQAAPKSGTCGRRLRATLGTVGMRWPVEPGCHAGRQWQPSGARGSRCRIGRPRPGARTRRPWRAVECAAPPGCRGAL
jgi:hypothetical protein